jgi:hypothetical protein
VSNDTDNVQNFAPAGSHSRTLPGARVSALDKPRTEGCKSSYAEGEVRKRLALMQFKTILQRAFEAAFRDAFRARRREKLRSRTMQQPDLFGPV